MSPPIVLLHRDAELLAVCKPAGLLVHRGLGQDRDTLVGRLAHQGEAGASPTHRLDRATSGVLVLALTKDSARAICGAFARGECDKRYLALVRGQPPDEVLVDHPIPADEGQPRVAARTVVRRLGTVTVAGSPLREARYSLVRAQPLTGRYHQVRRHLKHLGHPVVGDTSHGRSEHNRFCAERFGLDRLALHALGLELPHPAGGRLRLEAPLPSDLAGPLVRLGLGALVASPVALLAGW